MLLKRRQLAGWYSSLAEWHPMRLKNVRAIKGLVVGGALRESGDHTKLPVRFYVWHVANRRILAGDVCPRISRSRGFYEVPFLYDTAVHLRLMQRLNASTDHFAKNI